MQAQQEAIKNVVKARSNKFVRRLSVAYPEQEDDLFSRIRVSTMMKVVDYCDVKTQVLLATVNKYFNSLIRTSRTEVDIKCQDGWVDAINCSPFLKTITLRKESSPEDTKRFCKIIKNDGFPELSDLKLVYVDDDTAHSILTSLNTKISRSIRLNILNKDFTAGITFAFFEISQRICYAFEEAAQDSLHHVLGRLRIITDDVDGLENFFKTVDFSSFSRLDTVILSSCPLQRRGFELFIRSLWPEGIPSSDLPPIRILHLDDVQLHNTGVLSMASVMARGLFANLEELNLSSNKITDKGILVLADRISEYCCPNLKVFNISDNFIGVSNLIPLFNAFTQGVCPLLSEIEFAHTGIGASDLQAFAEYLRSPYSENLTRLNISNNPQVTSALPVFFQALTESDCQLIKVFLLEGVSVSNVEIIELAKWLLSGKASHLRALVLKSNLLDQESFYHLLSTLINPQCPRLSVIDFSSNLIGNFDESMWLQLIAQDGAEVLFEQVDYSFNPLCDNDMRLLLMFMKRFSRLERTSKVIFTGNNITAETMNFYFKAIPEGPCCLNYVLIDSCSLAGVGIYFYDFFKTASCSSLTSLSLRDCQLTKKDLFTLMDGIDLGNCPRLDTLRLDGNPELDNSFVKRLIKSIKSMSLPTLSQLDTGYTSIDAEGVQYFIDYINENPNTRLQSLDLTSIDLTSDERNQFKDVFKDVFNGHCSF